MAKLYNDVNMYAYTNYTSYDVKLFIYVQGLHSRYLNIIGRTYSELYCDIQIDMY